MNVERKVVEVEKAKLPDYLEAGPGREFAKARYGFEKELERYISGQYPSWGMARKQARGRLEDMASSLRENPTISGVLDYFQAAREYHLRESGSPYGEKFMQETESLLGSQDVSGKLGEFGRSLRDYRDIVASGEPGLRYDTLGYSLIQQEGLEGYRRKKAVLDESVEYLRKNMARNFEAGVLEFDPEADRGLVEQMSKRIDDALKPGVLSFELMSDRYAAKDDRGKDIAGAEVMGNSIGFTASQFEGEEKTARYLMHEVFHKVFEGSPVNNRPILDEGLPELLSSLVCSQDKSMYPSVPRATYLLAATSVYVALKDRNLMSFDDVFRSTLEKDERYMKKQVEDKGSGDFARMYPGLGKAFIVSVFTAGFVDLGSQDYQFGLKPFRRLLKVLGRRGIEFDKQVRGAGEYGIYPYYRMATIHEQRGEKDKAHSALEKNVELNPGNQQALEDQKRVTERMRRW